ncbi:hypothetical protein IQ07DRAFT_163323 [Pyrenochaeta sp. DS3sAY3a]|nr:hypothetical protein IQ07DRAFT_163323 [Pyrenochaeta sp. DS3sAY3a]
MCRHVIRLLFVLFPFPHCLLQLSLYTARRVHQKNDCYDWECSSEGGRCLEHHYKAHFDFTHNGMMDGWMARRMDELVVIAYE